MKPRRGLILFIGLALALIAMIMLGRAAYRIGGENLSWLNFAPKTAHAAVTFGGASESSMTNTQTRDQDITVSGSDILIVACFITNNGTIFPDAVTFNGAPPQEGAPLYIGNSGVGVALSDIATSTTGVITVHSHYPSSVYNQTKLAFYNGVDQSGADSLVGQSTATSTGSSFSQTVTASVRSIPVMCEGNGDGRTTTAGSGTTKRTSNTDNGDIFDAGSDLAAGNQTLNVDLNASANIASVIRSYRLLGATPGPSVSMYFPGDSTASSSVPEFRNWLVDGSELDPEGDIWIEYSLSTSTLGADPPEGYVDTNNIGDLLGARNAIFKTTQLWRPPLPVPVTWYALAKYVAPGGSIVSPDAVSPIQQFSVAPTGTISGFPSSTDVDFYHAYFSTSTTAGVAQCSNATGGLLDDPIGNIVDGMCAAFNPDPVALQSYSQLGNDLSVRPPFGYFGAVKTGLTGITPTSSALSFLTASSSDAFSDVFTPIRTGFSVVIGILAGFWIWNRIRHFEP